MQEHPYAALLTEEQKALLADIFARNRARFGHDAFRMEADPDDDEPQSQEDDAPTEDDPEDKDDAPADENDEPADDFDADRALKKIRKLNSENRNLRKAKEQAEEKAKGSDEKDTRIKALEAENLRIRIGAKHGLPDELIDRLKGDTEEDILADAEKLLAVMAGKKPPTDRPKARLRGGTDPDEEPEETDPRKLAALIPRR